MSTMRDAPILKAVADVIKAHVGKALGSALTRIDAIEGRLNDLPEWFAKGFVIPKGDKGDRGDDGLTGQPGPAGTDGKDGASGANGLDGAKGFDGIAGQPGRDGKDGVDGKDGERGLDGAAGKDGAPGQKGLDGASGKDGEDGLDGKSGEKGEKGLDGKDGLQGIAGVKGLDGKDGRDGIDGKDAPPIDTKALSDEIIGKVLGQIPAPVHGKDGRDGKDAEQLDVNDIVSKILGQIPPPIPGKDGIKGVDGINGKDAPPIDTKVLTENIVQKVLEQIPPPIVGADGKDGTSVDPDSVRLLVAGEVSKAVAALPKPAAGRDGRDGRVGEQGEPGKDAAEFDILNGMDESASYQRGVYVKHRNGIFRAYRTTDPVTDKNYEAAGWMCMQSNIVDIVESLAPDQRTVIKTHEFSDGSLITSKYKSTAMIYRGVFKEGQPYETGDVVTAAGSSWVCGGSTIEKPGVSKHWTLAIKRGSDGKDLRPRDDNDPPLNGKGSVYLGAKR